MGQVIHPPNPQPDTVLPIGSGRCAWSDFQAAVSAAEQAGARVIGLPLGTVLELVYPNDTIHFDGTRIDLGATFNLRDATIVDPWFELRDGAAIYNGTLRRTLADTPAAHLRVGAVDAQGRPVRTARGVEVAGVSFETERQAVSTSMAILVQASEGLATYGCQLVTHPDRQPAAGGTSGQGGVLLEHSTGVRIEGWTAEVVDHASVPGPDLNGQPNGDDFVAVRRSSDVRVTGCRLVGFEAGIGVTSGSAVTFAANDLATCGRIVTIKPGYLATALGNEVSWVTVERNTLVDPRGHYLRGLVDCWIGPGACASQIHCQGNRLVGSHDGRGIPAPIHVMMLGAGGRLEGLAVRATRIESAGRAWPHLFRAIMGDGGPLNGHQIKGVTIEELALTGPALTGAAIHSTTVPVEMSVRHVRAPRQATMAVPPGSEVRMTDAGAW